MKCEKCAFVLLTVGGLRKCRVTDMTKRISTSDDCDCDDQRRYLLQEQLGESATADRGEPPDCVAVKKKVARYLLQEYCETQECSACPLWQECAGDPEMRKDGEGE